jgi:hypothetical protein
MVDMSGVFENRTEMMLREALSPWRSIDSLGKNGCLSVHDKRRPFSETGAHQVVGSTKRSNIQRRARKRDIQRWNLASGHGDPRELFDSGRQDYCECHREAIVVQLGTSRIRTSCIRGRLKQALYDYIAPLSRRNGLEKLPIDLALISSLQDSQT